MTYLDVDADGLVTAEAVADAVREDTLLVSVMHVNNGGLHYAGGRIGPLVKAKNPRTLFHVDAVQSFGKLPVRPQAWQADLLTVSAHKIHGPKGCGALYCRGGLLLAPLLHGGDQEQGVRPGTENMAGIVGFAAAVRLQLARQEENYRQLAELKRLFLEELQQRLPMSRQNGPLDGAPHIVNLTVPDIKGKFCCMPWRMKVFTCPPALPVIRTALIPVMFYWPWDAPPGRLNHHCGSVFPP